MNTIMARRTRNRSLLPPSLEDFLAYWESIRNEKKLPGRPDLDPGDIPAMLPFVFLVDVLDREDDFRYRLVGTDIVRNTKKDFTGAKLSEISEIGSQAKLIDMYRDAVATRAPVRERFPYTTRGGVGKFYDVIVAPLAADGEKPDILFGYALHGDDAVANDMGP